MADINKTKRVVKAHISDSKAKQTIGAPGAVVIDNYLVEDERNASLLRQNKFKTYSNLLANVSIVSAGVRYFLNLVSKAEWKLIPSDIDNPEAVRLAAIVTKQMGRMDTSWSRVIRRAAMYRFYGFSVQEWTMEVVDGLKQFKDVAPRPQATITKWDLDVVGRVARVGQEHPLTQEINWLPRWKTIYIVDDSLDDSPEGLGLFRHIVESCTRLQRYEQLEGYGFESDLRGIPVGKAPFAALAEAVDTGLIEQQDMDDAIAPIESFIRNHVKNPALGLMLDSITYQSLDESGTISSVEQWGVDLMKGSATSLPDMYKSIERVNREIARALGVEGLLLGEQTSGSHALSKDKSQNFALIVESTLGELSDTFQKDFVERMFELNGWDMDLVPTFDTETLQHRDITQITQALKDLASAGAQMDVNDPATDEIRKKLGLSKQPFADPEVAEARRAKASASGSGKNDETENRNPKD